MTAPRLRVLHPDLDLRVDVEAGAVRLVEGDRARLVMDTVLDRAGPGGRRRGHVEVDGRRLSRASLANRVRAGLAVVSGSPVAPDVTVHDHVAAIVGNAAATDLLRTAPLLAGRQADPAGVLSGGERRVLAWLRALALHPKAVVLDGAAEGMDAATLRWATNAVASWTDAGVAVLVRPGRHDERAWATP